jgi:hypothetical protein
MLTNDGGNIQVITNWSDLLENTHCPSLFNTGSMKEDGNDVCSVRNKSDSGPQNIDMPEQQVPH